MALIILTPGEITNPIGGQYANDTVLGTSAAETVHIAANGKVELSTSFRDGNDTVKILGNAGDYTASRDGGYVVLKSAAGAEIRIPFKPDTAVDVDFADATGRDLLFTGGVITLGGQVIANTGSTEIADGSNGGEVPAEGVIALTVGQDTLTGTSGNDIFDAIIAPNQNGEQTNQLQSGDRLNGGAGRDELQAEVQDASALNSAPGSEIRLRTTSVESLRFTAEHATNSSNAPYEASYGSDAVRIDAENAYGVDKLGSFYSDASLSIYNVNTLGNGGLSDPIHGEDNGRATSSIKVVMDHTVGGNAWFEASNFEVLFDADYLIPGLPETGSSSMYLELVDIDGYNDEASSRPLETNPWDVLQFNANGTTYSVEFNGANDLSGIAAYQALAASINEGLAADGLTTFTASVGTEFTVQDTDSPDTATGYVIVITDSAGATFTNVGFRASGFVPGDTDYHKQVYAEDSTETYQLITSNIELEKVGQGGDGGYLHIGSMNTGGIEQFNVKLLGADNQDSSLSALETSNNTLREVYVTSDNKGADLTIGNSNTWSDNYDVGVTSDRNAALQDVQIFDASSLLAGTDVTLYAHLSYEFAAKYLNLMDDAVDASADNIAAIYTFGAGDDTLNINLSQDNFAFDGATTREDFAFVADMGKGNDTVYVQIGDGDATRWPFTGHEHELGDDLEWYSSHWYTNHLISENLTILTGEGDDFINTWGSSAANIIAGEGNDVIYTDNSGVREELFNDGNATWVFNSQNRNVSDLLSFGSTSLAKVSNLTLTVQYKDFIVKVDVGGSKNSLQGVTITDLSIVQAIKDAINNDPVLKDFLVAQDGQGRSLLVLSKVDGETASEELSITLGGSALPTGAATGVKSFATLSPSDLNALGFASDGSPLFDAGGPAPTGGQRWDSQFGLTSSLNEIDGRDSETINNNRVEGGLGNDSIALSTDSTSIEHVVIKGAFGIDHILNFSAAIGTAADAIAEVQSFTFTGTANRTFDISVTIPDGENVEVAIANGDSATVIAGKVADAIRAVNTVAEGYLVEVANGKVTITYPEGEVATATVAIEDSVANFGTQTIAFTVPAGAPTPVQNGNTTISVSINGVGYPVTINNGDDTTDIANAIIDQLTGDGPFTLALSGINDVTITYLQPKTSEPSITGTLSAAPYEVGLLVGGGADALATTVSAVVVDQDGSDATDALIGYDIFDLSAIVGQTFAFANTAGVDEAEFTTLDGLVDGAGNWIGLIDELEAGDAGTTVAETTEIARLNKLLATADGAAQSQATTGVVIVVHQTADDLDGTYGNFYKVTDGVAAGDATATLLGTVYLGGSEVGGRHDAYGNFTGLTASNFTPLSANDLMDTYFGGIIV